ncbi:MAG: sel1 repeat family protein [Nitrospirae bacterium]|nr:sel1 repeat family protein [Nitrospirota bacterium]
MKSSYQILIQEEKLSNRYKEAIYLIDNDGDLPAGIESLIKIADENYRPAIYMLIIIMHAIKGKPYYEKVAQWFDDVEEYGSPMLIFNIAELFLNTPIKRKTQAEIMKWLHISALYWPATALILAGRYYDGRHTTRDINRAAYYYYLGARGGNFDAQYRLGIMYESGIGVSKNLEEAIFWIETAAMLGHVRAQRYMFFAYNGLASNLPASKENAAYWLKRWIEGRQAKKHGEAYGYCEKCMTNSTIENLPYKYKEHKFLW